MSRTYALVCAVALLLLSHLASATAIAPGPGTIGGGPISAPLYTVDDADFYHVACARDCYLNFVTFHRSEVDGNLNSLCKQIGVPEVWRAWLSLTGNFANDSKGGRRCVCIAMLGSVGSCSGY